MGFCDLQKPILVRHEMELRNWCHCDNVYAIDWESCKQYMVLCTVIVPEDRSRDRARDRSLGFGPIEILDRSETREP